MKRIRRDRKLWLCRHQRLEGERKNRARDRLRERRTAAVIEALPTNPSPNEVEVYRRGRSRVVPVRGEAQPMPEIFCLDRNPDETLAYLTALRERSLPADLGLRATRRQLRAGTTILRSYSDFSTIKTISASAALLLAAEYDRIQQIKNLKMSAVNLKRWNPAVRSLLNELGFLELVGIEKGTRARYAMSAGGVRIAHFRRGHTLDPISSGELTDLLATMIEDCGVVQDLIERNLYGALVEAMENAIRWAYPVDGHYAFEPIGAWWMTGAVDAGQRRMNVVLYDQGVSIPARLPEWDQYPTFRRLFRRAFKHDAVATGEDDAFAIRTAIKVAKTSTGMSHHGKGLAVFKDVIDRGLHGHLRILSRRGDYLYERGKRPTMKTLSQDIGGTLIEWEVLF